MQWFFTLKLHLAKLLTVRMLEDRLKQEEEFSSPPFNQIISDSYREIEKEINEIIFELQNVVFGNKT